MWTIQHMLAGAAIGKTVRRPWIAWPGAHLSHLALDFSYHIDNHARLVRSYQAPSEAFPALAASDVAAAVAIPVAVWLTWRQPRRWAIIVGAWFADLMDLTDSLNSVLPEHPLSQLPVLGWIHHSHWHRGNPAYSPWQWGMVFPALVIGMAILAWNSGVRAPSDQVTQVEPSDSGGEPQEDSTSRAP